MHIQGKGVSIHLMIECGRGKQIDKDTIGSKRINILWKRAIDASSLSFAASVGGYFIPFGISHLMAMHLGKVSNTFVGHLIGDNHVVERLFYLGIILLFIRPDVMETLVEFYPESITTEFSCTCSQEERLGRIREIPLVDGQ